MAANIFTGATILDAIKDEISARDLYLEAVKKVKNPLVRRRLLGLADDELEHRETLSRLYWAQTGREPGEIEVRNEDLKIPDMSDMTVESILELAMEKEREASEKYETMAGGARDERSKLFLEYLVDFEKGHYEILEDALNRVKKNPGWENQTVTQE